MATDEFSEVRLKDPLSDVTRKERRSLLVASVIGITIVKAGLIPSKISALGIEFVQTDKRLLLIGLGVVILYFLTAFVIYALSDFIAWRLALMDSDRQALIMRHKIVLEALRKGSGEKKEDIYNDATFFKKLSIFLWFLRPISVSRALLEFLLPIVVGTYAVVALFLAKVPSAS